MHAVHRTRPCPHLAGSHPITSHTPLPSAAPRRASQLQCSPCESRVQPRCSLWEGAAPCIPSEFTRSSHAASQPAPHATASSHSCATPTASHHPLTPAVHLCTHVASQPVSRATSSSQPYSYPTHANDPCACSQARQLPSRPPVQLPAPSRGSYRHPTAAPVRLRGMGVPYTS